MRKKIIINVLAGSIALMLCVALTSSYAKEKVGGKTQGVAKTTTNDVYRPFLINNIMTWYSNCGDGSYNPNTLQSGFEFPKGSGKFCTFEDGLVWGGKHKGRDIPKVGGSTYWRGLQAGPIKTPGGATENEAPEGENPDNTLYRAFTVRPDITPSTTFEEVQTKLDGEAALISKYSSISARDLYQIYQADWREWPAKSASNPTGMAPFKDVDGDGLYNPDKDIPGQPGSDETLYYVANDCNDTRTTGLYGSPVIGIEMHRTVWAYNLPGALGNTVFESSVLINKSGALMDSTYLVQWADVDNGDANDDYSGCDQARGLGYTYNGKASDATYGAQVPAVGYTFFQGPIIKTDNPADSAVFHLQYRYGYKNMGMTTFVFFINGNATYVDPDPGTGGDKQWYNLMQGLISSSGADFINPLTNEPTKFTLNGDPVNGTGWIDGTYGLIPGDRRQCQVTGPFTFANGDTQEVVVAHLVGLGSDRISSISVMRWYSDLAQAAYNSLFNISAPPPSPAVKVDSLDRQVILNWDLNQTTEAWNSNGYEFEGYNVYQFPEASADLAKSVRLATYDKVNSITVIFDNVYDASSGFVINKPVEFGTDSGIKRTFSTTTSSILQPDKSIKTSPLANGSEYYYGVTSYSFKAGGNPVHLESAPSLIAVTPKSLTPGVRINSKYDQSIDLSHSAGISTALPTVNVISPAHVVGADYEINVIVTDSVFNTDLGVNVANPRWQVVDKTHGNAVVYGPSTDFTAPVDDHATTQGIQVSVVGAPFYSYGKELGANNWTGPTAYNFTRVNPGTPGDASTVSGKAGIYAGNDFFGLGILGPNQVSQSIAVEFCDKSQGQYAYDFVRFSTGSTGTPYYGYFQQPFKVWELNSDGTHKRQVDFMMMEAGASTYFDSVWAPGEASGDREYWFIVAETYTPTAKAKYTSTTTLGDACGADSVVWSGWMTLTDPAKPAYAPGDVWTLQATNIVTDKDKWTFTTRPVASTHSTEAAKTDVAKINVFPNPYIGFNPLEINKYERFVTFSHLPQRATIRIFNLAGVLVRTLRKNTSDQFFPWDLKNENGFPVAAGMYIAYIDMPDLGTTKTLKLGVIPEQQYIDRW